MPTVVKLSLVEKNPVQKDASNPSGQSLTHHLNTYRNSMKFLH